LINYELLVLMLINNRLENVQIEGCRKTFWLTNRSPSMPIKPLMYSTQNEQ